MTIAKRLTKQKVKWQHTLEAKGRSFGSYCPGNGSNGVGMGKAGRHQSRVQNHQGKKSFAISGVVTSQNTVLRSSHGKAFWGILFPVILSIKLSQRKDGMFCDSNLCSN